MMIVRMVLHYDGVWEDHIHTFWLMSPFSVLLYDVDEIQKVHIYFAL